MFAALPTFPFWELVGSLCGYFLLVFGPMCLLVWGLNILLSLPLRRQERARFFLDLLEHALKQNRPVEQALVELGDCPDRVLGKRFQELIAPLRAGARLGEALQRAHGYLPARMIAMLRVGEKLGDLRKVLPACRAMLDDGQSGVRGAVSYFMLFAFGLSPSGVIVTIILAVKIFPKFNEVLAGALGGDAQHGFDLFYFVQHNIGLLLLAQFLIFAFVITGALLYVGGPGFIRRLQFDSVPITDWIAWRVSWKRKRLQRDCSAMLAVLLDGGVPEPEALLLAGESGNNTVLRHRVIRAGEALAQGVKLTDAVESLDDRGEFRWRLTNAVHARGDFLKALKGWHEALDATAFQQEQAAAHFVTTGLVLCNGLIVALVMIAVFGALISIVNAGVLW